MLLETSKRTITSRPRASYGTSCEPQYGLATAAISSKTPAMNSHSRSDLRAGEIRTCSGSFHLQPSNDLSICERLTRARQISSKTASTTTGMNHNIRLFKKFIITFHARLSQAFPEFNLQFSSCRRQFHAAGSYNMISSGKDKRNTISVHCF